VFQITPNTREYVRRLRQVDSHAVTFGPVDQLSECRVNTFVAIHNPEFRGRVSMRKRERRKMQGLGLLIAGFGLGVGLLLAPTSGRELRSVIGRGCRKAKRKIERQAESWQDHAEDLMEHAKHLRMRAEQLRNRGIKLAKRYRAA
jgi:hypothetical protein